ncbi:MAG: GNAT family N-acetyltransferase [Gemmatimonadales bacterium]
MTPPTRPEFVVDTSRLRLRQLTPDDAQFILELVNDLDWILYIGDRGVHDLNDARQYVTDGPMASYERHGFGLYLVTLRAQATPIGICGLIQRESLPAPDLGFAFLPPFRRMGYASEAADAIVRVAPQIAGATELFAVVQPDNARSFRLLDRLGFRPAGVTQLVPDGPQLALLSISVGGVAERPLRP